jgi:hypothetical protein
MLHELLVRDSDCHREAKQATGRRAQGPGMVGMDAQRCQSQAGRPDRFGDSGESTHVTRILEPGRENRDAIFFYRQAGDVASSEPSDRENTARRIRVAESVEELRRHFQWRPGKLALQLAARGSREELGRSDHGLESQPRAAGFEHQMRPFEQ